MIKCPNSSRNVEIDRKSVEVEVFTCHVCFFILICIELISNFDNYYKK